MKHNIFASIFADNHTAPKLNKNESDRFQVILSALTQTPIINHSVLLFIFINNIVSFILLFEYSACSVLCILLMIWPMTLAMPQDRRVIQVTSGFGGRSRSRSNDEPRIITRPRPGQEFVLLSSGPAVNPSTGFRTARIGADGAPAVLEDGVWVAAGPPPNPEIFNFPIPRPRNPTNANRVARIEASETDTVLEDGVLIAAHLADPVLEPITTPVVFHNPAPVVAAVPPPINVETPKVVESKSELKKPNRGNRKFVIEKSENDDNPWRPLLLSPELTTFEAAPVAGQVEHDKKDVKQVKSAVEPEAPQEVITENIQKKIKSGIKTTTEAIETTTAATTMQAIETTATTTTQAIEATTETVSESPKSIAEHKITANETASQEDPVIVIVDEDDQFNLVQLESAVSSRTVIKTAENGLDYEYEYLYYYDDEAENSTQVVDESLLDTAVPESFEAVKKVTKVPVEMTTEKSSRSRNRIQINTSTEPTTTKATTIRPKTTTTGRPESSPESVEVSTKRTRGKLRFTTPDLETVTQSSVKEPADLEKVVSATFESGKRRISNRPTTSTESSTLVDGERKKTASRVNALFQRRTGFVEQNEDTTEVVVESQENSSQFFTSESFSLTGFAVTDKNVQQDETPATSDDDVATTPADFDIKNPISFQPVEIPLGLVLDGLNDPFQPTTISSAEDDKTVGPIGNLPLNTRFPPRTLADSTTATPETTFSLIHQHERAQKTNDQLVQVFSTESKPLEHVQVQPLPISIETFINDNPSISLSMDDMQITVVPQVEQAIAPRSQLALHTDATLPTFDDVAFDEFVGQVGQEDVVTESPTSSTASTTAAVTSTMTTTTTTVQVKLEDRSRAIEESSEIVVEENVVASTPASRTRGPSRLANINNNNNFASKIRNKTRGPVVTVAQTTTPAPAKKVNVPRINGFRRPPIVTEKPVVKEVVASDATDVSTTPSSLRNKNLSGARNRFAFRRQNQTDKLDDSTNDNAAVSTTTEVVVPPRRPTANPRRPITPAPANNGANNRAVVTPRQRPSILQRNRSSTTTPAPEVVVEVTENATAIVADENNAAFEAVKEEIESKEVEIPERNIKPTRFNRLEVSTETTTTTTAIPVEKRIDRLRNRPAIAVSQKPKTVRAQVSLTDRRNRFSAANRKTDAKESIKENDKIESKSEEISETSNEDVLAVAKEKSAEVNSPSSSSLPVQSQRQNRKPGQLLSRRFQQTSQ